MTGTNRVKAFSFPNYFPLITFLAIWALQIFLYVYNPYNFHSISDTTWLVIIGSITSVVLGYFTFSGLSQQFQHYHPQTRQSKSSLYIDHIFVRKTILVLSAFSFLAILSLFYLLASSLGGISTFFTNRLDVRNMIVLITRFSAQDWNQFVSAIMYVYNLNYVALLLAGILFITRPKLSMVAFFPLINALIFSLITFQRYIFIQSLIYWLFSCFVAVYLDKQRQKFGFRRFYRLLFVTMPMVFIVLLTVIILRIDFGDKEVDYLLTLRYAASSIYVYFAGNIVALDHFLNGFDAYYYGGSLFRSFFKWFARFGIVDGFSVIGTHNEFVSIGPFKMNTYTFIRPFYEDLGVFSLLVYSFTWGFLTALSTFKLFKKFSLLKLHFSVFFYFSFFISFFNYSMLNITLFFYFGLMVWLIETFIIRSKIVVSYE